MLQGARQASVPSTASGARPDTASSGAILLQSDQPPRDDAAARQGGRGGTGAGTGAESLVRGSVVAPRLSCGICGGLLRDATAFTECLHAFCRECIHDKVVKDNIKCCPKCGVFLGNPLVKLRPDHSLQHIRSLIFPPKRRKVVTMKKRKERVSSESTISSVLDITAEGSTALTLAASESKAQKDLAFVERDALSGIKGRDFDSACGLTEATGALIVWQASPILEDMVVHNQLDSKQDPESFKLPLTSDIENQRQRPTPEMTNISFMVESSSSARPTIQDDENLRGDFLTLINENNTRIMGRYDAHMSKLKAENTKLIEELEHGRADNQALMSDVLEKSEELATLKYYSNMLESEKTHLENQLDHLNKELKYTREEHRRYVSKVLDAARAIPNDLEPINSNALPGSRRPQRIC